MPPIFDFVDIGETKLLISEPTNWEKGLFSNHGRSGSKYFTSTEMSEARPLESAIAEGGVVPIVDSYKVVIQSEETLEEL